MLLRHSSCLFDESEVCCYFASGPISLAFLLSSLSHIAHILVQKLKQRSWTCCSFLSISHLALLLDRQKAFLSSRKLLSSKLSSVHNSICLGQGRKAKCHPCLFLEIPYPAMLLTLTKERSLLNGFIKDRRNNLKMYFVKYGFARCKTLMATIQSLDGVWQSFQFCFPKSEPV